MRTFRAAKGEIRALGFAPDGGTLVAGYTRKGVFAFDLANSRPAVRLGPQAFLRGRSLHFTPDGAVYWSGYYGRTRASLEHPTSGAGPSNPNTQNITREFCQTADGLRLISLHGPFFQTKLIGWHQTPEGWAVDWSVDTRTSRIVPVLSPQGDLFAYLVGRAGEWWHTDIVTRNTITGELLGTGRYPHLNPGPLTIRPDGKQIVVPHDMTLLFWSIPGLGHPEMIRNDTRRHFTAAAYHPDSRYLFTTSNDTTITVWDSETKDRVTRFVWNVGRLRSVAISPDGTLAAVGSDRGQIVVWDLEL